MYIILIANAITDMISINIETHFQGSGRVLNKLFDVLGDFQTVSG